jgi:hypothetical protein
MGPGPRAVGQVGRVGSRAGGAGRAGRRMIRPSPSLKVAAINGSGPCDTIEVKSLMLLYGKSWELSLLKH